MFSYITRQPIFVFGPDESGGSSTAETEEEGDDTPEGEGNAGDDEKKKRQAELNRKFAERAKRAEEAERKRLWEALGVKDQEEFDAYVKAKKEAEDAQKSALEKAQDEAKKALEKADKLETDHKTAMEAMQKRIIHTEIKVAAGKEVRSEDGKIVRPAFREDALDDVVVLLEASGSNITMDEDGKVTGIPEALEALAKAKPFLLEEGRTTNTEKFKGTPPEQKTKSKFKSSGSRRREDDGDDKPIFESL